MNGRSEADFSASTRRILASRAGWRCSFPRCPVVTVGPGAQAEQTANIGIAAHIHSAALNGPRGRGGLSDEELASVENGIWCCATHGRLIDTNAGAGYSVETLREWKRVREEQARREMGGLSAASGWVEEVRIARSPLFMPSSVLRLEKCVLLEGGSFGKTALFQWLEGASGRNDLARWSNNRAETRLDILYNSPMPHRLEFTFFGTSRTYVLDNTLIYTPTHDLHVVHLRENSRMHVEGADDLEMISRALNADRSLIRNLAPEIDRNARTMVSGLRFVDEPWEDQPSEDLGSGDQHPDQYCALYVHLTDQPSERSFCSLSGGETDWVYFEFSVALARERARNAPTLLLLDALPSFSRETWAVAAKHLLEQPFQTLAVVPSKNDDSVWESWGVARLERINGMTVISQQP